MFYLKNTEFLKWKELELWLNRIILKDTILKSYFQDLTFI